ncbi:MAG: MBL fold metallo-hydrolase [Eubacteriales bacterium]
MKKLMKITIIISMLLGIFTLYSCSSQTTELSTVEIEIFDIGKADAILIDTGSHCVLIDTGETDDGSTILEYLIDNNIGYIDYLIITHFDNDHIGGAPYIVNSIGVGEVIQPDYDKTSNEYIQYSSAVLNKNIPIVNLTENMQFTLDSADFTIYPPKENNYDDDNDYSLVTSLKHGDMSLLFAGDADKDRLTEIISQGNLEHTFLKVPHHGDYNKMSKDFLNAVNPEYAVITCSDKNKESKKIMKILDDLGTKVYLTRNGDVNCISNGKSITINQ